MQRTASQDRPETSNDAIIVLHAGMTVADAADRMADAARSWACVRDGDCVLGSVDTARLAASDPAATLLDLMTNARVPALRWVA